MTPWTRVADRCVTEAELLAAVARHRAAGRRVVFTNGGFDLLHVGHVRMLGEAARLGDVLVVGVNDDASVRASKGPARPVVPAAERAELVAAVAGVDHVVVFADRTVDRLLAALRPDVHAKGRDYDEATHPEADTNRAQGTRMAFVGDEKRHASSDVADRLRAPRPTLDRAVHVGRGPRAGARPRGPGGAARGGRAGRPRGAARHHGGRGGPAPPRPGRCGASRSPARPST